MTQWGLDTLFNPAKRHMDEEKQRLQSTREEVGDNSGGKRIDLESGKVSIKRVDPDDENPVDGDSDGSGAPAAEDAGQRRRGRAAARDAAPRSTNAKSGRRSTATPESSDGSPSPAAIRAAQRRGRTAR